jgi:predicted O-methyltransferase YrrM
MTSACDTLADCIRYLEQYSNWDRGLPYSPVDFRYALVLYTFASCAAARTILEIGVGPESVSGVTFIHALGEGGHLISVDIDDKIPQQKYRDLATAKGVAWTVVHGDSLADETQVPLAPNSVDVLYIDGNHEARYAEGDLRKFLPYLRPGGYLIIDDFPPLQGVGEGRVGIEAQVGYFLHLAHNAPAGNGRLCWQKPL